MYNVNEFVLNPLATLYKFPDKNVKNSGIKNCNNRDCSLFVYKNLSNRAWFALSVPSNHAGVTARLDSVQELFFAPKKINRNILS